jgi:Aspartate/tyrosine/aromatic aminotransferase
MTEFARRAERISISGIREVFEAAGEDAINMGLGQPDFPTPEHAKQAAKAAMDRGDTDGYTENKGTLELRGGDQRQARPGHDLEIPPGNVIATRGGGARRFTSPSRRTSTPARR